MWSISMSSLQSLLWLRHPLVIGAVLIWIFLKSVDYLIGKDPLPINTTKLKSETKDDSISTTAENKVDLQEDGPQDIVEENVFENNNFKDNSRDAAIQESGEGNNDIDDKHQETDVIMKPVKPAESVLQAFIEEALESKPVLRDTAAQTRARESVRHSAVCRGCGVERSAEEERKNEMRDEVKTEGDEVDPMNFKFDRDHTNTRSMSDTFKYKKKAATIDSTQLVSVHHYIGKLVQVSASSGVMVGDNNCMHMNNSHSENCLSPEETICNHCRRQRMTDDQKSMATQANFDQSDISSGYYGQSEDDLDVDYAQSEEEILSCGETPPLSPPSTSGEVSFESKVPPPDGDTYSELTFEPATSGDPCEYCPNCLNKQRQNPPYREHGDIAQLYVEAKLKIFQATKELREHQGRSSRRFRQNEGVQTTSPASGTTNTNPATATPKSKGVRESVRKLLKRRKPSRERENSTSTSDASH